MPGRSYIENRGDDEVPFGYVYYEGHNEDTRLGYSRCEDGHVHVFVGNWGTPSQVAMREMTNVILRYFGKTTPITTAPLERRTTKGQVS